MYKIYLHRDINNQIFYVGCTKVKNRPYNIYKIYSKYPKRSIEWFKHCNNQFTVEIVAEGLTQEQAYELEIELIAKYGRQCDGGILVNKAIGGHSSKGILLSDKHKKILLKINSGKIISEYTKQKMSESSKGSKNGRAKQVICTITGKIWDCAKDCAEENNFNISTFRSRLSGHLKNNTTFEYYNPD